MKGDPGSASRLVLGFAPSPPAAPAAAAPVMKPIAPCIAPCIAPAKKPIAGRGWSAEELSFGWSGWEAEASVLVVIRTTHTWSSRSPAMRLR